MKILSEEEFIARALVAYRKGLGRPDIARLMRDVAWGRREAL